MPRQPVLRSVRPGDQPARVKPKSLTEAAKSGTELEQLEFLRDRLACAIEDPNCPAPALASLSRRFHEVTKDIAAILAAAKDEDGAADTADEAFDSQAL